MIVRNGPIAPEEIEDLRSAVGWDRCEGTYEHILRRHFAYYTARAGDGRLIGYVSVLSDGIADAFLLDLMVHPDHQRSGLGSRLVRRAIADMKQAGIQCVQVTFNEPLEAFYAQCGFHIFKAGIIDFKHMSWDGEGQEEDGKDGS
ncbi:MAG: GNAT family N-acetyltransferase [bacterium]|nr:GNAT family N-acetyltransferase [bacterium]